MTSSKQRIVSLDALRVCGIVAIVAGHVWAVGTPNRLLYAWHVPVFFFLTGWLWTPGRSFATELGNRTRTLLVPYIAWLVVVGVIVAARGRASAGLAKDMLLGGQHLGRPFTAFWFVTALFVACLLRRALDRFGLAVATAVGFIGLLVAYGGGDQLARVPESAGMALPALFFICCGEWARRIRFPAPGPLGGVLVAAPLLLVAFTDVRVVNLKSGHLGTPVAGVVIAVAVCLGAVLLLSALERVLPAAVVELAAVGLAVVLSHAVVLWLRHTPPTGRWLDFVLATVIPFALALAIARTPASRLLIAWPKSRAPDRPGRSPRSGDEALDQSPSR